MPLSCRDVDDSSGTNKTSSRDKLLFLKKKKKKIDVSKLLQFLWQWNNSDICETLISAVTKVLKDKSNDNIMIQTKQTKALSILGWEFYTMEKKHSQNNKWQNDIVLREKIRIAFAAILQNQFQWKQEEEKEEKEETIFREWIKSIFDN